MITIVLGNSSTSPSFPGNRSRRSIALCTCAMIALPIGTSSKLSNRYSINLPVESSTMSENSA